MSTTWVEVSAGALERNYREVQRHAGVPVCAVVKANAYGHGLTETARIFKRTGAPWLAVTRAEEARALRDAGIEGHVLVLTPPPDDALADSIEKECSLALGSVADVERYSAAAAKAGKPARVHLKVDTGMGRLGVMPEDAPGIARRIADDRDLVLEGVWTHFADAAGPSGREQLAAFVAVKESLGRLAARTLVHASNSAAVLALPDARFDLVRVGTLLYGQDPPGTTAPFPLEETFNWYARVVAIREVPAGGTVGYGGEWKAKKHERIATLAIGYADGFTLEPRARTASLTQAVTEGARSLAAVARPSARSVSFGDRTARVVGRVGMQAITVSLNGLGHVMLGDVARIPARRLVVSPAIDRVYVE